MTTTWTCPRCSRQFARKNQKHVRGSGDRSEVLRNRSAVIVDLYGDLEVFVQSLGPVEIFARERYVLFRTTRIFADLSVMVGALRLAIHLPNTVHDPAFIKTVSDSGKTTHVMLVADVASLEAAKEYLRQAYEFSLR